MTFHLLVYAASRCVIAGAGSARTLRRAALRCWYRSSPQSAAGQVDHAGRPEWVSTRNVPSWCARLCLIDALNDAIERRGLAPSTTGPRLGVLRRGPRDGERTDQAYVNM